MPKREGPPYPKKADAEEAPKDFEGKFSAPELEEQPIVMMNTILSKQAGLKEKKQPRKRLLPHDFESIGGDPTPAELQRKAENERKKELETRLAAHGGSPEQVIVRGTPETRAEYRSALRRSVENIEQEMKEKEATLRKIEESERTSGIKKTEAFQKHNGGSAAETKEEQFVRIEKELHALAQEKKSLLEGRSMIAINDNQEGNATSNKPETGEAEAEIKLEKPADEPTQGNVTNLDAYKAAAERRNKKNVAPKRRGVFGRVLTAALAFFGAAASPVAAGTEKTPVPAEQSLGGPVRIDVSKQMNQLQGMKYAEHAKAAAQHAQREALHATVAAKRAAEGEKHAPKEISVSIDKKGEGADKLIASLQAQLREKYTDSAHAPDTLTKEIMDTNPHVLSLKLGFVDKNGKHSAPVQMGDSLTVTAKGELLFHHNSKHHIEPQKLMEGTKITSTYKWAHHSPHHAESVMHAEVKPEASPAESTHESVPSSAQSTTPEVSAPVQEPQPAAFDEKVSQRHNEEVNVNGFNLKDPNVGTVKGILFAHAANSVQAFDTAQEHAFANQGNSVFYVEEKNTPSGIERFITGLRVDPVTHHIEHVKAPDNIEIPKNSDYQPLD